MAVFCLTILTPVSSLSSLLFFLSSSASLLFPQVEIPLSTWPNHPDLVEPASGFECPDTDFRAPVVIAS